MNYKSKIYVVEKDVTGAASVIGAIDLEEICYKKTSYDALPGMFVECFDTDLSVSFIGFFPKGKNICKLDFLGKDTNGNTLKSCRDKKRLRLIAERMVLEYGKEHKMKWLRMEMFIGMLKAVEDSKVIELVHYGY